MQFLWFNFGEFGIASTNNPLSNIFLYFHHVATWCCIDILKKNSVLVIHGSLRGDKYIN